jgi:hypothetical protein
MDSFTLGDLETTGVARAERARARARDDGHDVWPVQQRYDAVQASFETASP